MILQSISADTVLNAPVALNPTGLYDPAPNAYSHVYVVPTPGRIVYVSGQGGETEDGVLSEDFLTQVQQALTNVQTALNAAAAEWKDVVKLTVLIVNHDEHKLGLFGAALKQTLGGRPAPACTLIPVPRLALDGMLVEIEATAVLAA